MKATYWQKIPKFHFTGIKSKKNPTILAFSAYFHDSSACLIKNGLIAAAVEEERFTRIKHDNGFPINAINYCLTFAKNNEIDAVVFFEDPSLKYKRVIETIRKHPPSKEEASNIQESWRMQKSKPAIQKTFQLLTNMPHKIIFLNHHSSHAASSYYVSGFDKAAILTIDGVGEKLTTTLGYAEDNEISLISGISFPHSIGLFYTAMTIFLGFRANSDEYKVMGLAAYGNMNPSTNPYYELLIKTINLQGDGSYSLDMQYFGHEHVGAKAYTNELIKLLGVKPRTKDGPVSQEHKDIAAATQLITEHIVISILNHLYAKTHCKNVCVAGGVALNSVINGKILSKTPFKKIFIHPAAGDAGTALGAALYVKNKMDPHASKIRFTHSYLGPAFSSKQVKQYLDENNIKYHGFNSEKQLLSKVAKLIQNKQIVGWFQGRMEWGPRALGNRSILASPLNASMQSILNAKVKHRELFRPFAPAVCIDDASEYFECDSPIPTPTDYMLMVYPIRKEKRKLIPAVTHIDGSGRLQTVRRSQNPLYYKLIKEFGKTTGIPILVNTSFNIRGEPIVCTPHDAYRCMMGTGIDCLIIDKFIIYRKENKKDAWNSDSLE